MEEQSGNLADETTEMMSEQVDQTSLLIKREKKKLH